VKWGDFVTQTGQKGNILNPNDWFKMILGGVVLIITFATSQNIVKNIGEKIGGKVPYVDTDIDPITRQPIVEGPSKRIY